MVFNCKIVKCLFFALLMVFINFADGSIDSYGVTKKVVAYKENSLQVKDEDTNYGIISSESNAAKRVETIGLINNYLPYFEMAGSYFSNINVTTASADLFIPVWQLPTSLIFADIKAYNYSRYFWGGNFYLGYRHLLPENQIMYGVYCSFSNNHTKFHNYFNQVTLGGEFWFKKLFIGGNFYQPIGKTSKFNDNHIEKLLFGMDAEAGFEFVEGLVGYVGGYYFKAEGKTKVYGPKVRLTYDFYLDSTSKTLGVFDKIGFEAGIYRDRSRGNIYYLSSNLRFGFVSQDKPKLSGVYRQMIAPIRQHMEFFTEEIVKQEDKINETYDDSIKLSPQDPPSDPPPLMDNIKPLRQDPPSVPLGSDGHSMPAVKNTPQKPPETSTTKEDHIAEESKPSWQNLNENNNNEPEGDSGSSWWSPK